MRRAVAVSALVALVLAGCSIVGASQITVATRNESDEPMVVRVIAGHDESAGVHGPTHTVPPATEGELTLGVPGGDWTVQVNGGMLLSTSDPHGRVGKLPVTLAVMPNGMVVWEAPSGWAEVGP
ncbi:MAG: hypothetical protein M3153_06105 [Chloroflexota bacterium]|nr:hypothetical protein [Chloroflexota bacterium]